MSTKAVKMPHAHFVSVELNVLEPDVVEIGKQMLRINPEAYMSGMNWDVFIDHYLAVKYPEMRTEMERDPEVGTYLALYRNDELGNKKADILVKILNHLITKPAEIYGFLEEEGDGVEWH